MLTGGEPRRPHSYSLYMGEWMEWSGMRLLAEPVADLLHVGAAVGVVEVAAGAEDLDGFGAGLKQAVEQPAAQPLPDVDVGGNRFQHECFPS